MNRYIFKCWKWDTPLAFYADTEEEARAEYKRILGREPGQLIKALP